MFDMIWTWITGWIYTQREVDRVIDELQVDEHTKVEDCGDCPPIDSLTKSELINIAVSKGISINKSDKKEIIYNTIRQVCHQ